MVAQIAPLPAISREADRDGGRRSLPRSDRSYAACVPSLLYAAAHPDDDTFGVSGSIALHAADKNLRLVVVYATDGEAGEIAPDSGVRREDLGRVRRTEARASWDAIGRQPDRTVWLGLPDGGLADLPSGALAQRLADVLEEERPDIVATMEPNGVTGHPDHIALSSATTDAFHRVRPTGPGLRRLLYAAIPRWWVEEWNRQRREAGLWEWDPTQPYHLRGVPDDTIGVEVDTSSVVDLTLAAVRSHRTQWSYQTMGDDPVLAESLRFEHWVFGWPERPPGSPLLKDIFEDLS